MCGSTDRGGMEEAVDTLDRVRAGMGDKFACFEYGRACVNAAHIDSKSLARISAIVFFIDRDAPQIASFVSNVTHRTQCIYMS